MASQPTRAYWPLLSLNKALLNILFIRLISEGSRCWDLGVKILGTGQQNRSTHHVLGSEKSAKIHGDVWYALIRIQQTCLYNPPELTWKPKNEHIGRWNSFWETSCSGSMLVFGRVKLKTSNFTMKIPSLRSSICLKRPRQRSFISKYAIQNPNCLSLNKNPDAQCMYYLPTIG